MLPEGFKGQGKRPGGGRLLRMQSAGFKEVHAKAGYKELET